MVALHPFVMRSVATLAAIALLAGDTGAQVHYHPDGNPWKQRASDGPDAAVDGWYYNLGVTGIRVQLIESAPTVLLVQHVLKDSPASSTIRQGDILIAEIRVEVDLDAGVIAVTGLKRAGIGNHEL